MQMCEASGQDRDQADGGKKLPLEGPITKYGPLPADWTARGAAAMKMTSEAFILLDQGDFQNAEKLFKKAQQTDYPNGMAQKEITLGMAELDARQKRYPEAIHNFYLLHTDIDSQESDIGSDPLVNMEFALTMAEAEGDWWAKAVEEYEVALVRLVIACPAYRKAVTSMEAVSHQTNLGVHRQPIDFKRAMPQEQMFRYLPPEWNVQFRRDTPNYNAMKAITNLFIGTHGYAFRKASPMRQLAHLLDSIRYDPQNPYAYYEYGVKLNETRQYQEAKDAFVKARLLAGANADLSHKAMVGLQKANAAIHAHKQRHQP